MILSDTITTSTGDEKTNLFISPKFHVADLLSTGKVPVSLSFYNSSEMKNSVMDSIYPMATVVIRAGVPAIDGIPAVSELTEVVKVTNCVIDCSPDDLIKKSGTTHLQDVFDYFYKKLQEELKKTYGWSVTL